MEIDTEFDSVNAGSSYTYPLQAGAIKKGMYLMIKNHPCKVTDVTTSKTGKHGHAKAHFIANDIFTGKKMEELAPTSHNVDVPFVVRKEYQVLDAPDNDDFISLSDENGNIKEDLKYPDDINLKYDIIQKFNLGNGDTYVSTISALGEEMIMDFRIVK